MINRDLQPILGHFLFPAVTLAFHATTALYRFEQAYHAAYTFALFWRVLAVFTLKVILESFVADSEAKIIYRRLAAAIPCLENILDTSPRGIFTLLFHLGVIHTYDE